MQQGDLDRRGIACTARSSRRDPANAEAFYNLGLALKQKDDFGGAETELRRAMRLDPSLPEAPFTLGVVLWQTGRGDEAVQQFREAIARKPDYAEAHYMLGMVLKQQGGRRTSRRAVPRGRQVPAAVGRSAPQPRPGAQAAGATRARRPRELAEAERLNRSEGRRAGGDVRGERRHARS